MHKHEQIPKKTNLNCSTGAGAHHAQMTHDKMGPSGPTDNQRMVKVSACVIQTLPGLERLGGTLTLPGLGRLEGKTMRQLGRGQEDDEGNDVSGYFVLADGGAAVIFKSAKDARQWANNKNQVNIEIAPSLTYIDSDNVSLQKLTNIS